VKKDKIKLVSAMTIFGTIGLVRKIIPYSSTLISFVRAIIGTLFLLGLHFIKKEQFNKFELKNNLPLLCASGIALGAHWVFIFESYRFTTVAVGTICNYMAPVFVLLATPFILKEKIPLKKGICAVIAVVGMVFVSGVIETGFTGLRGIMFALASAVMYATVIILNKKIRGLSGNERTIVQLGVTAVVLGPYVLLTEHFTHYEIIPSGVVMLLVAGILHTGIVYALYFGSIQNLPASTVALFSYIDPAVAVLISAFILREGLTFLAAIGVIMVIGAAVISEIDLDKRRKKRLPISR